jgi:hypothetical protein
VSNLGESLAEWDAGREERLRNLCDDVVSGNVWPMTDLEHELLGSLHLALGKASGRIVDLTGKLR